MTQPAKTAPEYKTAADRDAVEALLWDALRDSGTAWSLGSFGAIAEFMRDPDESVSAPGSRCSRPATRSGRASWP
jgi:hypothetical protein